MWIKRLDGLILKVAEASGSFLLVHGVRVGAVARQVRGTLFAPHMEMQIIKCFGGDRFNVDGWPDLVKVAKKEFRSG